MELKLEKYENLINEKKIRKWNGKIYRRNKRRSRR